MEMPKNVVEEENKKLLSRRKRLSRKEQKARRKKQKQQQHSHHVKDDDTKESATTQPQSTNNDCVKDYLSSYVPTPIPTEEQEHTNNEKKKSLGKWFPKALVLKSSENDKNDGSKCCLLLFYQYVAKLWSTQRVSLLISYLSKIASTRKGLGGRIRVAPEGINATVSALSAEKLHHFCQDLRNFDAIFGKETDFKLVPNLDASRHFKDLRILPVQELVFYGVKHKHDALASGGIHLKPTEFHDKLSSSNAVVIDVRNHYEAAIGRFDGQEQKDASSGAQYIDPKMRKSTDFPSWLEREETKEKLQGKTVMMFCTGGIRCERASAHVKETMGDSVEGVYQLQGGIEAYLQTYKDGGHWRGKNFVFDKREAFSASNPNGDGGVVVGKDKNNNITGIDTKCCICGKPWDRYVGKKKCDTCGVPVLMCDACMSVDKKKKDNKKATLARCPLCVEQNITVLASQVEYTNNGKSGRLVESETSSDVAASTVLKWGGGHASKKKEKRRMKRKPCRFGSDCKRKDCFFAHPEESGGKQQET